MYWRRRIDGSTATAKFLAALLATSVFAHACNRQDRPTSVSATVQSPGRAAAPIPLLASLPGAGLSTNLADALSAVSGTATRFVARSGNWVVTSGVASERTQAVEPGLWFDIATRSADQRDGSIKVSLELIPGSGSPGTAGVTCRLSDEGGGAAVAVTEASGLTILALRSGRPVVMASQPAAIPEGRWIALTVNVSGTRIRATVDDGPPLQADIADLPATGRVGVFRQQHQRRARVVGEGDGAHERAGGSGRRHTAHHRREPGERSQNGRRGYEVE